jgi:hypothetical protein
MRKECFNSEVFIFDFNGVREVARLVGELEEKCLEKEKTKNIFAGITIFNTI